MTDILKFTFWNALGVFLLEFILICLLIPESFVKTQMREEVMDIADKLGQPTAEEVRTKTTDTFDKLFVRSGVYTTIHRMVIPTEAERMRSVGMEDLGQGIFPYVEERLEAMWYSVTQVIMRVFHFMIWLPFLLLIIVPAILDGIYQRKIRISTFRHVSALRHRAGFQGVVTIVFGLFILAMMPFSIPTLLFPVVGVAIAFMVNMSITFTQKRL